MVVDVAFLVVDVAVMVVDSVYYGSSFSMLW